MQEKYTLLTDRGEIPRKGLAVRKPSRPPVRRPLGPFRWQFGLLLLSLPRRLIAGGFSDLPQGGPYDALP